MKKQTKYFAVLSAAAIMPLLFPAWTTPAGYGPLLMAGLRKTASWPTTMRTGISPRIPGERTETTGIIWTRRAPSPEIRRSTIITWGKTEKW